MVGDDDSSVGRQLPRPAKAPYDPRTCEHKSSRSLAIDLN